MNIFAQRSLSEIPELLHLISDHFFVDHSSSRAASCSLIPLLTVNHLFHEIFLPKLYTSIKLAGYDAWRRFLDSGRPGWSSVLEFDLRITDQILEAKLWTRFLSELVRGSFGRLRSLRILFNCSSTAREKLETIFSEGNEGQLSLEKINLKLIELKLDGLPPELLKWTLLNPKNSIYKNLSVSISQLQIDTSNPSVLALVSSASSLPIEDVQRLSVPTETHPLKPTFWRRLPSSVERLDLLLNIPFPCPNSFMCPSWQGDNAISQLEAVVDFLTNLKEQRALGQQLELKTIDISAFAGSSRTWSGTFATVVQAAEAIEGLKILV